MLTRLHRGFSYAGRASRRLRSRGVAETVAYSYAVARNALLGAYVDIVHTAYPALDEIFRIEPIKPDDVLVDVGCGDGRVINFWLSRGHRNRMVGIEIDHATAQDTKRRMQRYANVLIIHGDPINIWPAGATVFCVYNSFAGEPLAEFERTRRGRPGKIIIYNYTDLAPFIAEHWTIRTHVFERHDCQYRVAVINPNAS